MAPAGSTELNWQNPTIDIATPSAGTSLAVKKNNDIQATVTNDNSETTKIGWFCTAGTIQNRRAASTTWNVSAAGAQTLIVVAHGIQSRGFALKVIDVSTN